MKALAAVAVFVAGLKLAASGYPAMLLVAVAAAAVLWVGAGSSGLARAARADAGHAHGGTRKLIARHEAGHVVAARAIGGSVRSAWITNHAGEVHARNPDDPVKRIAFYRAGRSAAGSGRGCPDDNAAIRGVLSEVPRKQRGEVKRAGIRLGDQLASRYRGEINRIANQLNEKGRL